MARSESPEALRRAISAGCTFWAWPVGESPLGLRDGQPGAGAFTQADSFLFRNDGEDARMPITASLNTPQLSRYCSLKDR
jgi:hypothetical protein